MGHMFARLFKPGAGHPYKEFVAAIVQEANATYKTYRGDVLFWSLTDPTTINGGVDADGQTLGSKDFGVFVTNSDGDTDDFTNAGLVAGVAEGPTIGSTDTVTALEEGTVVIVQRKGPHEDVYNDNTSAVARGFVYANGGTTNVWGRAQTVAEATLDGAGVAAGGEESVSALLFLGRTFEADVATATRGATGSLSRVGVLLNVI